MNNPHNLTHEERGITRGSDFNKGINFRMSKERRVNKQKRHKENLLERQNRSRGTK